MKGRNLLLGLTAIAVLALATTAFAATRQRHRTPVDSTSRTQKSGAAVGGVSAGRGHHAGDHRRQENALPPMTMPFTAGSLTSADKAQFARTGSFALPINFTGPGTVDDTGDSPVGTATEVAYGTGPEGETEKVVVPRDFTPSVQPASVTATEAGTEDLTLTLTDWAKSQIAAGHDVELLISLEPSQGASEAVGGMAMFVLLPGR